MTYSRIFQSMIRSASLLLIAVACLVVASPARAKCESGTSRNEAIVRQAFDNWAKVGNVFAELLAPDVRWTIHGSGPVADTYVGLKDFVERASMPVM